MTRIVVETKISLTGVGVVGALLFVAAPAVLAFMALDDARFGRGGASTAGFFVFAGIAASLGLVLLMIGRQYQHAVQIVKPSDEPSEALTPPFGGTEAERRNLGLK